MPTLFDRLANAYKALRFPTGGGNNSVVIFPTMNDMQDAILRALTPNSQPSDDPNLSSLVAAGITWLSSTLPEPDLQVKRKVSQPAGQKLEDEVIEDSPLYALMERPNPYTSGSTLWKAFAYSWIIDGNAYFLKFRNNIGQVIQLWYEPHFTIKARWVNDKQGAYISGKNDDPKAFINYYEVVRDGEAFRVEVEDVIHFRDGVDPFNTRYGLSRLKTLLREIYGDSAVASYAAKLLGGNGVIPFVLGIDDSDGQLSQADLDNIKARMLTQTSGANAGQGLVLSSRMTFERTGMTPQEMDIRTSRYMAQEMYAAVTGIPPQVLNFGAGLERSIYNNMAQADRRAVDQYLQPLWWHIAQELTHQLLRDIDLDGSHFVEFDISEVGALQEDENERWKRIALAYESGIIKRSEAREAIGYDPSEGDADEVYYVRGGAATVTIEQEQELRDNPPLPQLPPQAEPQLSLVKKSLEGAPQTVREIYLHGYQMGQENPPLPKRQKGSFRR